MTITLHEGLPTLHVGAELADAKAAMILIHGRGAGAQSMMQLTDVLVQPGWAYLAPHARNSTWYPQRFVAPIAQNEPWLSSALARIDSLVGNITSQGIPHERIMIGGFSQGACLALEYAARHPRRYAGVFALSGGLIGPDGTTWAGAADALADVPVFLGCSDVDFHIPLARVKESTQAMRSMGATVEERIYPGMGHTINDDEVAFVRELMAR